MGIGQDFSSANDTDTDVDETIVHTNIDKFDNCLGETNYQGDSEEDLKSGKADEKSLDGYDSEPDNSDLWKCIRY